MFLVSRFKRPVRRQSSAKFFANARRGMRFEQPLIFKQSSPPDRAGCFARKMNRHLLAGLEADRRRHRAHGGFARGRQCREEDRGPLGPGAGGEPDQFVHGGFIAGLVAVAAFCGLTPGGATS